MKRILLRMLRVLPAASVALGLVLWTNPIFAQQAVSVCLQSVPPGNCFPVSSTNPLPVTSGGGGGGAITAPLGHATADVAAVSVVPSATAAFPITGSISNTSFAATQPTAANLNATVVGTGTFVTQSVVTQPTAASLNATVVGTGTFATQAAQTGTWTVGQSSPYPATAVPLTASATGTTGATTATLTNVTNHTTYICGFSIRANATATATNNATVTGTITGTLNFTQWTAPSASGLGVTEELFNPCIPASAVSVSIAVVSGAPGTGGVVSVTAWGYSI